MSAKVGGTGAGDPRKPKKVPKPAAIFRKPIPEESFQKRYLGLLELEADKAFLESSFAAENGQRTLAPGLGREAMVRLNKLGKEIKANRGVLKTGPLVMAGILVAALVVFVLFFMNPLLGGALEKGLEAAFGAKAEVAGFRLDLLDLEVSMRSVAVADRDEPMTNLFEIGKIDLKLDPASLIRGKVYVQEAVASSIALGTPRKTSGALPSASGSGAPRPAPSRSRASGEAPIVDLSRFDAAALVEREKSKFSSAAAFDAAGAAYADAAARWKDRASSSGKSVAALASSSKKALAIDPKSFKSPADALKAASELSALADSAGATAKEAEAVASGLRSDADSAAALEKDARKALDRDFDHLKSFVDPRSGAASSVLEPVVLSFLSGEGQRYFRYGNRALEVAMDLAKKSGADKASKPKKAGLGVGRNVAFPAAALPKFRLGHLGASFVQERATWTVDLREVSSDPALVPAPTSLDATMVSGKESASLKAVVDLRKESSRAFSVDAKAQGYPVNLGESFAAAGIGGFTGRASGRLEISGEAQGGFAALGGLDIADAAASEPSGLVGRALADSLASAGAVKVEIGYEHPRSGADKYSVRSNLDGLVAKALKAAASRYAEKAVSELRAAMKDYASKELESKLVAKVDLDGLLSSSLGDSKSASSVLGALSGKKAALEARAKELGAQALGGSKLPEVKVPKIKAPKLKP